MNNKKAIYTGIDWFTGTKTYSSLDTHAPANAEQADALATRIINENLYWEIKTFDIDLKPTAFYKYSYSDGNGLKLSLSERQSQGVKIEITGQDWSIGEKHQYEQWQALHAQQWKPTRFDVAFDFMNFGYTALKLWERGLNKHAGSKRGKATLITSASGGTVAIGSRTSERYLRLYDKGKQQGTEDDWFRIELEIKGRTAQAYFQNLEATYRHASNAIRAITSHLPDEAMDFLIEFGHGLTMPEVGRKQTRGDREKWLLTQIVPILKEERDKDSAIWRAFITALSKP